ncbi:acyl-CoA thioesterase, partial [Candidatus Liberibacter asiaticus]
MVDISKNINLLLINIITKKEVLMVCQMHSSGVLTLKIQTMPTDVNLDGNVFGGWIMSQIDIACGIRASQLCKCRVVTKAVTELLFEKPIQVSDLVHIYTQIRKIGKTS